MGVALGSLITVGFTGYLLYLIVDAFAKQRIVGKMFGLAVIMACFFYAATVVYGAIDWGKEKVEAGTERIDRAIESVEKVGEGLNTVKETPGNTVKYVEEKKDGAVDWIKKLNPWDKEEEE